MLSKKQIPLICLFLTVIPLIAFWQLNHFDFINFDDPHYVTENLHIQNGITIEAIRWAFTTMHQANWHPLTWISHMLDVQLFGLKPGWHHLTNLLFHIANTLLLFFVLNRMTKAPWQSAFVAALFALHPLHVESVAWVAERKDVLSTFFWMLTMGSYAYYVEHLTEDGEQRTEDGDKWTGILLFRPSFFCYSAVLIFFALGLMAKPMLVTLPFVLLLLDYWPLRRFEQKNSAPLIRTEPNKPAPANQRKRKSNRKPALPGKVSEEKPAERKYRWTPIRPLLWEKVPLFALTALSCIVTYIAQQKGGAVGTLEALPPSARIANTFVAYIAYIVRMIWPTNLAFYYPHPGLWPLWQVMGAVLLLMAITALVAWKTKKFPYLAPGWLWFAGTLVPVIGLVQVGGQSMADRYTYIPLIGLFIMIAWGIPDLLKKWRYFKESLIALSVLSLSSFFILTWLQVGYWQNSIALYDHALEVSTKNYLVYCNRGVAYAKLGNYTQALEDYDRTININPNYADAYYNRGIASCRLGNPGEAIPDFDRAIKIGPVFAKLYYNRGLAHDALGNFRQAIGDFDQAIEIDSTDALAYNGRAAVYGKIGNSEQAVRDLDRAIGIDPKYADAYYNRGIAYSVVDNYGQAISDFDKAVELNPNNAQAYNNRGSVYGKLGDFKQAIGNFDKVIEIDPKNAEAYYKRGFAHGELGNVALERDDMKTAARLNNEEAKKILRSQGLGW